MKIVNGDREYSLTLSSLPGNRLPKRGETVSLILNGAPFVAKVTNNRAWSGSADKWLDYIWVTDPESGKSYYVTLEPGVKAETWKGAEVTISMGVAANYKLPARVTEGMATEREMNRVKAFKSTWAERYSEE